MIKDNILKVREHISLVCSRINRNPKEITVIAVSKDRTSEQIRQVIEAGIVDIGENRVQEAHDKFYALHLPAGQPGNTQYAGRKIKWHLVGHLQTNKVKEAVKIFDLIHSVDSLRLAYEIDKHAAKINKVQDILLEVRTSPEATKFGFKPEETAAAINEIAKFKNINTKGLMTIAPMVDVPEKSRPYFRTLREFMETINVRRDAHNAIRILSMGMSDDFEIAIEEGANMVRLGRAIFGG